MTVLSFSSPLLRAVLRLERDCFLSGLPSTGAALRGFTGWGLQRQTGDTLQREMGSTWKRGHRSAETHHFVVNAPTQARPQGSCAQHSSAPDYLPPPHFTPSSDLAPSQGQQRPPTNFSAPITSLCQGHPSPSIFPPSSSILEPFSGRGRKGDQPSLFPSFPRTVRIPRMWGFQC